MIASASITYDDGELLDWLAHNTDPATTNEARYFAALRAFRDHNRFLHAALREARSMLKSCALDEPDDELQASWDRGLTKIEAALKTA